MTTYNLETTIGNFTICVQGTTIQSVYLTNSDSNSDNLLVPTNTFTLIDPNNLVDKSLNTNLFVNNLPYGYAVLYTAIKFSVYEYTYIGIYNNHSIYGYNHSDDINADFVGKVVSITQSS